MTQPPPGPYGYGYGYPPPGGYPGYGPAGQQYAKPPSNMGWAIASLLLFWPLCIPAFIYATRVDDAWSRGDVAGAVNASRSARTYGLIGTIIGAVLLVLGVLLSVLLLVVFANSTDNFSVTTP